MARKVFLSFLGNTNYGKCTYHDNNGNEIKEVRFVQEATIQLFCNDCDRYVFFLTEDAERKNWVDDGHKTRDGDVIRQSGLRTRIINLNLGGKVITVPNLPTGISESEIWKIFEIVYDQIEPKDQIIFDITHALRSIPMLVLSLINYAKFLKNIKVSGIYYGVFEPSSNPVFPILNLNSFSELQDWTSGADAFINFGSSKKINSLLSGQHKLQKFNKSLSKVTGNFSTSRGGEIVSGKDFKEIQFLIQNIQEKELPAPLFKILLEEIKEKIEIFQYPQESTVNSVIQNLFNSVQWCIDHDLIQQGFTLMQEGIFTIVLLILNKNYRDKTNREIVSCCFKVYKLPKEDWRYPANEHPDLVFEMINGTDLFKILGDKKIIDTLTNLRNDLNHAGFNTDSCTSSKFATQLKSIFIEVKQIIELK